MSFEFELNMSLTEITQGHRVLERSKGAGERSLNVAVNSQRTADR